MAIELQAFACGAKESASIPIVKEPTNFFILSTPCVCLLKLEWGLLFILPIRLQLGLWRIPHTRYFDCVFNHTNGHPNRFGHPKFVS